MTALSLSHEREFRDGVRQRKRDKTAVTQANLCHFCSCVVCLRPGQTHVVVRRLVSPDNLCRLCRLCRLSSLSHARLRPMQRPMWSKRHSLLRVRRFIGINRRVRIAHRARCRPVPDTSVLSVADAQSHFVPCLSFPCFCVSFFAYYFCPCFCLLCFLSASCLVCPFLLSFPCCILAFPPVGDQSPSLSLPAELSLLSLYSPHPCRRSFSLPAELSLLYLSSLSLYAVSLRSLSLCYTASCSVS